MATVTGTQETGNFVGHHGWNTEDMRTGDFIGCRGQDIEDRRTRHSIGHSYHGDEANYGHPDSNVKVGRKGGLASLHGLYIGTWRTFGADSGLNSGAEAITVPCSGAGAITRLRSGAGADMFVLPRHTQMKVPLWTALWAEFWGWSGHWTDL